ncbi:hypothetical protein C1Y63_00010 [Corynebacterium sp. 13CS0277]|uniref:hypothetical protein n=1 Tax=Corynebacterium sp. 13CS0277 TaxID=2071994 RepID=UPI000D022EC5|nr:hypothetical protein [Corynebacterium sp. 13CS0277]PRQ12485.1 hypothetical protein C1Y63_00010 [Corynebacterium sp. 13CS0277]
MKNLAENAPTITVILFLTAVTVAQLGFPPVIGGSLVLAGGITATIGLAYDIGRHPLWRK